MADLEKQMKESNDKILRYRNQFRGFMQDWQGNPKLKKYRDWAKDVYIKVNDADNFSSKDKIKEIDSYVTEKSNEAARKNNDADFDLSKGNFNVIATIITNLWKWLKEKKRIQKEIKELKDKQSSKPKRCGKPRVGHGAEGLLCKCFLGEDNTCRYHGPASAVA